MPVFCLFTLGRRGNFTAGVTWKSDLLCTALALNIEILSNIMCRFIDVILESIFKSNISMFYIYLLWFPKKTINFFKYS